MTTVVLSPAAEEQLATLFNHIADVASVTIAERYVEDILKTCAALEIFPQRGTPRNDIRPGMRITHHKGRAIIAYYVRPDRVAVVGIFYGGQDYETMLQAEIDEAPEH